MPSSAVSVGAGAVAMVKSVTVTAVEPLVSVSPPLWVMLPASVLASTLPPVIGKARLPSGLAVAGEAGVAADRPARSAPERCRGRARARWLRR